MYPAFFTALFFLKDSKDKQIDQDYDRMAEERLLNKENIDWAANGYSNY